MLERSAAALVAAGLPTASAAAVAASLVAAQRDGKTAHGLGRLPAVLRSVRSGTVVRDARPVLSSVAPAIVRVDAQRGLVQPALALGLPALARAARDQGVACLSVVDCRGIVGSLWYPLERLCEEHGLAALAFCNSPAFVAQAGGSKRVFGTNPVGFGWPRSGSPPLVLDFACSTIARGEMQQLARRGEPLPAGCALDEHGRPTTDAAAGLRGTQLAFGGHKGSALALMVELLSAALLGTELAVQGGAADEAGGMRRGLLIVAFDPTRQHGDALQTAEALFEACAAERGARLPSAARHAARAEAAARGGVLVDAALLEECFGPGGA